MPYTQQELDKILEQTLDDRRVSRTEKRALSEVFADLNMDSEDQALIRHRVFALARNQMKTKKSAIILDWAEEIIKVLHGPLERDTALSEVHFSPGDQCRRRITRLLRAAEEVVDICVFTITDDRLTNEICDAHERGVRVRIVSDNEKIDDRGSDVERLAKAGIEVCVDDSEHHMHHKFAVFDRASILTGSYNWTRSAALHNRENILVSDDGKLVGCYQQAFDSLWDSLHESHRISG